MTIFPPCPACGSRQTSQPSPQLRPNEHECFNCAMVFTVPSPTPRTAAIQAYAEWHGRTPTPAELAEYQAHGRRRRRVRDLGGRPDRWRSSRA